MAKTLLEMKNIIKEFGTVRALDNVNLKVEEGEIHAICGENGAGKSTLMNVLSGIYPYGTYEGDVVYDGEICKFQTIKDSEALGIVIIHQELALVPLLSFGENMFLGNERGSAAKINWAETYYKADELLKMVGLKDSSHTLVKDIGVGKQQLVEIAKALGKNVKLLILDEPTASLNDTEAKHLLDLLLEFKKQGMTSIIISHKLNEISYVADKITIIRDGSSIKTLSKEEGFTEDTIISAMVGRDITDRFPKRTPNIGEVCFEVKDWCVDHPVFDGIKVCDHVNFNLRKGEVLGISGLMGAGRTELAMSLFGKSYGTNISGKIFLNGKEIELPNVKSAINHKIAYVTEDRKGNGLILTESIARNTTAAKPEKIIKGKKSINFDLEKKFALEMKEQVRTKCASVDDDVNTLSGGNMQKVLLGKWLFAEPDILILDEPTRGIDVGAKYEIYCIINQMVAEGKSVLMISSELPEVLGMSDRIYVMNEGRFIAEMDGKDATQEKIMTEIINSGKNENL